jgi:hypothetical protein
MISYKQEKIKNIERLEIMEDLCGVTLEGLSVEIMLCDDDRHIVLIYGEVHSKNGGVLNENITIIATAFNEEGEIIDLGTRDFYKDKFFALEGFKIPLNYISRPTKIRIYPKKG